MEAQTLLKCKSCNIVVCELLTFVQNKHEVMDSESLVRICVSAFNSAEIENAKYLLFQAITTELRNIKRKRNSKEGKSTKDLFDIVNIFKQTSPEKIPVFVARDLNKLPPITFDHVDVTRLLKDIIVIKQEIANIKDTYVTLDQLLQAKNEISNAYQNNDGFDECSNEIIIPGGSCSRNINLRRGAYIANSSNDSGPTGLTHLSFRSIENKLLTKNTTIENEVGHSCERRSLRSLVHANNESPVSVSSADEHAGRMTRPVTSPSVRSLAHGDIISPVASPHNASPHVEASTAVPTLVQQPTCAQTNNIILGLVRDTAVSDDACKRVEGNCGANAGSGAASHNNTNNAASFAHVARSGGEFKVKPPEKDWVTIQRKKLKNRFLAEKGTASASQDSSFRAADIRVPLFINNVDKGTLTSDIVRYIENRTQVRVTLEKVVMKQQKEYDAYKVFVPRHKLAVFMNNSLWPEGISFRRFVNFVSRSQSNVAMGKK